MEQQDSRAHTVSKRQARAQRILDAASALILRWGYQKVSLDDIVRQTGVAKGTLYLHWKSREALFETLLQREWEELAKELQERIRRDSAEMTLREMVKHIALALMQRPLLKAVLLRDRDLLGELALREQSRVLHLEKLAGFATYLTALREQKLIRTDLSLQAQIYLFAAIFAGCFLVAPLLPEEDLADLIAETVACTLADGRDGPLSPTFAQAFLHYLDQIVARAPEPFSQGEPS